MSNICVNKKNRIRILSFIFDNTGKHNIFIDYKTIKYTKQLGLSFRIEDIR